MLFKCFFKQNCFNLFLDNHKISPEPNALLNRKIQSLGPQGFKCAIIVVGRTACGQKGGGVFLKGECLPFLCHSWHSLVVPLS